MKVVKVIKMATDNLGGSGDDGRDQQSFLRYELLAKEKVECLKHFTLRNTGIWSINKQ